MCELCDENAFSELNDGCVRTDMVRMRGARGSLDTASETSCNDDGLHGVPSISSSSVSPCVFIEHAVIS